MKTPARILVTGIVIMTAIGTLSFFGARMTHKAQRAKTTTQTLTQPPNMSSDKEPLSYKEVGRHSASDAATTRGGQRTVKYTVNVKSFGNRDDAEKLLDQLSASGLLGYYTPMRQGERIIYHVRLGIYSDESDAEKTLAQLHGKTKLKGLVTQLY